MPRAITDAEVACFQRHGFCVLHRFLSPREVAEARVVVDELFATGEEDAAGLHRDRPLFRCRPMEPMPHPLLNQHLVLPEICSFVMRALEIEDPLLVQTGIYAKYQRTSGDQAHHVDYPNNELAYPSRQRRFHQVSMMLYYDDVTATHAPTHLVSRTKTEQLFLVPTSWSREERPDLYREEEPAICAAGSILAWDMRTVHRASQMTDPVGRRTHLGIVYASASAPWLGMRGWGFHADGVAFQTLLQDTGPAAPALLGLPPPGHPYWDDETIAGTAARYPRLDLRVHREALVARSELAIPS